MAKQEFLIVKPDDFNPITGQLTVTIQYLDELVKQYVTDIITQQKPIKLVIKRSTDSANRTYEQLQKWWASLEAILRYYKAPITKETRDALHEQLKLSMFDAEYLEIGDLSIPLVPSLATMDLQRLANGLDKLVTAYDFIPEVVEGRRL